MQTQFNLFAEWREEPVAKARASDPETSHEAAASVCRISDTQSYIRWLIKAHEPMTDEEIYRKHLSQAFNPNVTVGMTPSGARSRRAELVKAGLVRDSGERRLTRSGRKAIVWEAV